jgi:ribosomal protein L22
MAAVPAAPAPAAAPAAPVCSDHDDQKRRRIGMQEGVEAVLKALAAADQADAEIVIRTIRTGGPQVRAVAALIRNGSVEKALEVEALARLKPLGRMIPSGVDEFGQLPKCFLWNTFWKLAKAKHPHAGDSQYIAKDAQVIDKMCYALNITKKSLLNWDHPQAEWEAPFELVVFAEYEELGGGPAAWHDPRQFRRHRVLDLRQGDQDAQLL